MSIIPTRLLGQKINDGSKSNMQNIMLNNDPNKQSSNEIRVSKSAYNESDIQSAINPLDSNNIILLPLQHRWDNVKDYYAIPPYYSKDFGETWSRANFELLPTDEYKIITKGSNPQIIFDKKGRAYLAWITNYLTGNPSQGGGEIENDSLFSSVVWAYSDNGGEDWTVPDDNVIIIKKNRNDKNILIEEIRNLQLISNPFSDKNAVEIYALVELHNNLNNKNTFQLYSYDSNTLKYLIRNKNIRHTSDSIYIDYPQMDVRLNGDLGLVYYSFDTTESELKYYIKFRNSSNGGINFDEPSIVNELFFKGSIDISSPFDIIPGTSYVESFNPNIELKIDKSKKMYWDYFYCQWVGAGLDSQELDLNIYMSRSTDYGKTWRKPKMVNTNKSGEQFLSDLSINKNGVIVSKWYDTQNFENRESADIYMTYSFDAGYSYEESMKVTSWSSSLTLIPKQNRFYGLGKKMSLMTTNDYALPVWADARDNDGRTDVFIGFYPIQEQANKFFELTDSLIFINDVTPNPTVDFFNLSFELKERRHLNLSLYDYRGKLVINFYNQILKAGEYNNKVDIGLFANGIYFLIFKSDIYSTTKKIVIQK